MGSGTLCVGCNWHEDSTAPEARRGCRLSLPGSARFHAAPRQYGGRGGFFWRVVCFVWAVTCMRRPPRRRRGMDAGSACGVIRRRRFLWGVMRFVWAVSHIWTAPPVRAEEGAGSACRADQSAFMRRHMAAEFSMGSGAFYRAAASMGSGAFCRAKPFCTGRESRDFFRQKSE